MKSSLLRGFYRIVFDRYVEATVNRFQLPHVRGDRPLKLSRATRELRSTPTSVGKLQCFPMVNSVHHILRYPPDRTFSTTHHDQPDRPKKPEYPPTRVRDSLHERTRCSTVSPVPSACHSTAKAVSTTTHFATTNIFNGFPSLPGLH